MGSLKNPRTWVPYINPKDCSKRVCTIFCTQWCKYIILPSPPPPPAVADSGGTTLSPPLMITIMAVSGSFLLLMGYSFIISRYCFTTHGLSVSFRAAENQEILNFEMEQENEDSNHVPWIVSGKGLDEGLIESIAMFKYKKNDGLVSCTDCSVCLGEFEEDERIRVLPKCVHAFHVYCIDTWLKTHSNCPLCRANVCCEVDGLPHNPPPPPPPVAVIASDLRGKDDMIEIREGGKRKIRRSVSTGCLCQTRASMGEFLFVDHQNGETSRQELRLRGNVGLLEQSLKFVNARYV